MSLLTKKEIFWRNIEASRARRELRKSNSNLMALTEDAAIRQAIGVGFFPLDSGQQLAQTMGNGYHNGKQRY